MTQLRTNVLANYTGSASTVLITLFATPIYLKLLGPEAFGLVAVFQALMAIASLADLGFSASLQRELSRLASSPNSAREMRGTLWALELLVGFSSALVGGGVALLAPRLSQGWLQLQSISSETARTAIAAMGLAIALRFPAGLYGAGLLGLQRQGLLNAVRVTAEAVRALGGIGCLLLSTSRAEVFFWWQGVAAGLGSLALALALRASLPASEEPGSRDAFRTYRRVWRFAAGTSGITITAILLTQMDKVLLSRLVTLESLGYYSLAATAAAGLYRLVSPLFSAFYPRFVQLATLQAERELEALYHLGTQLLAVIVLPVAIVGAVFAAPIMQAWTGNADAAANSGPIFRLLLLGTALNGLMNFPYAIQLAYGWTTLTLVGNLVAIGVFIPAMYALVRQWGGQGAAAVWLALNFSYLTISTTVMHQRLLRGAQRIWLVNAILKPAAAVLASVGIALCTVGSPVNLNRTLLGLQVLSITGVATLAAAFATPSVRARILSVLPTGRPTELGR
jgi:O-antigen/teichoic acid export membrane protein